MTDLRQTIRYCKAVDGSSLAWATVGSGPAVVDCRYGGHFEQRLRSPAAQAIRREAFRDSSWVVYDGRGTGLSDRDFVDITVESAVSDLGSVVEAADFDRFALCSGVLGAQAAITYAARHPERVGRLVLYGGFARGFMHRPHTPEELAKREAMLAALEVGWNDSNPAFRLLSAGQLIPDASSAEIASATGIGNLAVTGRQIVAYMRTVGETDVSAEASNILCPTLVIHARHDYRIPFEEGRRLAGLIPGARFVPVEGGNNSAVPSDPSFSDVMREIREFLAEGVPGGNSDAAFAGLTPRERDVLELIAQGLDNLQIAAHLSISEKTVRNNITPIFDKLGVENRSQAIVKSREAGLGTVKRPG